MKPRNCIEHACNRAMREPVYVVLRPAAKRRPWPHVVTVGPAGLQSFSPGAPSPHPIDVALRGYPGVEWDKDMADVRACMNEYNRGSRIKNKTRVTHAE